MITKISFCILRMSPDRESVRRAVFSIQKQEVPDFEILVYGPDPEIANVKTLPVGESEDGGYVNRVRNRLLNQASADFVVIMADTIELVSGWYAAMKTADFLDIAASRIVSSDGIRMADWAYRIRLGSRQYVYPLEYDEWTTKAYVSGDLMLLRRKTWECLRFNEQLQCDDGDDEDFSLRANQVGFKIGVVPNAQAICHEVAKWHDKGLTFEVSRKAVGGFKSALSTAQEAVRARDYAQAIAVLSPAIEVIPDDARALGLMGWCQYFNGQYDRAEMYFDRALAADPCDHFALRGRGWTAIQAGNHEQAVTFLTRARSTTSVEKRDDWIETLRGLAWSNYHIENYDDAILNFTELRNQSAIDEIGLLQDVLRGLGWSLYRKGLMTDASVHFRMAIEALTNGNSDLLQDARRGLELTGDDSRGLRRHAEECRAPLESLISKQGELPRDHRSFLRRSLFVLLRLFKSRGEA
jgi:tetratricopeptide (TPR) repeat protein